MRFVAPLVALALLVSAATAKINCKGSSFCAPAIGSLENMYRDAVRQAPDNVFHNGQRVASSGSLKCFYKNTPNGGTAGQAAEHINNLLKNGCNNCGSDPHEGGGELTCNYVV